MQPINNPPINTPSPPHRRNSSTTESTVTHPVHPEGVQLTNSSAPDTGPSRRALESSAAQSFSQKLPTGTTGRENTPQNAFRDRWPTSTIPFIPTVPENAYQTTSQDEDLDSPIPKAASTPNSQISSAPGTLSSRRMWGTSASRSFSQEISHTTPIAAPIRTPASLISSDLSGFEDRAALGAMNLSPEGLQVLSGMQATNLRDLSAVLAGASISTAISTSDITSTSAESPLQD